MFEDMLPTRFIDKVTLVGECWLWEGSIDSKGYGRFEFQNKNKLAHKYAYETVYGLVPPELELDHLCRNRWCVNPQHLEAVTHNKNCSRGLVKANGDHNREKAYCVRGHAYNLDNTRLYKGSRYCRACSRIASLNRYYALKGLSS